MNWKKIIIAGLIAGIVSFIVGSILYMNPLVSDIYTQHGTWPGAKSMDEFGGLGNWMLLMFAGGLVAGVFIALLYSYTEKAIKIKQTWIKGAFYGFLFWLATGPQNHYNIWLMYQVSDIINIIELFNSLIGSLILGIVLAVVYEKIK